MTKEALKLALEALKQIDEAMPFPVAKLAQAAIKEALAQPEPWEKFCDSNCVWTDHHPDCKLAEPEQKPVAWWNQSKDSVSTDPVHRHNSDCQPLYITPPPCPTCEALARTVMMDQTGRDA